MSELRSNNNLKPEKNLAFAKSTNKEKASSSSYEINETANVNEETQARNIESNFSELETINEDCLRHIVAYLNIFDVVNLAKTCTRLQYFAKAIVLPKRAKKICIQISNTSVAVVSASLHRSFEITLKDLERLITYFGEFVKELLINDSSRDQSVACIITVMIEQCKNLIILNFECSVTFTTERAHAFKDIIEKLQSLKELKLCRCPEITKNWPSSLESPSKVDKLTLIAVRKFSDNFYEYFKNLSSLNIQLPIAPHWEADLAKIFDKVGHCLNHLSLKSFYNELTIAELITGKLSRLESLELELERPYDSECLIALPYLKALTISYLRYNYEVPINKLLRCLSNNGVIEKLIIFGGIFDNEEEDASPLTFNNLKIFEWIQPFLSSTRYPPYKISNFLKCMAKAEMSAIKCIHFDFDFEDTNSILELLESKKNLIKLSFNANVLIPSTFWHQLIGILGKPCAPKRPLLKLMIYGNIVFENETVSLISFERLK